jgi:hypothetical protein
LIAPQLVGANGLGVQLPVFPLYSRIPKATTS